MPAAVGASSPGTEDTGPLTLVELADDRAELVRQFGDFSILVFDDRARVPRGDGLSWHRQERGEGWIGVKLYDNVQLLWRSLTRRIDGRWRRLDRILTTLARSRGQTGGAASGPARRSRAR